MNWEGARGGGGVKSNPFVAKEFFDFEKWARMSAPYWYLKLLLWFTLSQHVFLINKAEMVGHNKALDVYVTSFKTACNISAAIEQMLQVVRIPIRRQQRRKNRWSISVCINWRVSQACKSRISSLTLLYNYIYRVTLEKRNVFQENRKVRISYKSRGKKIENKRITK